MRRDHYSAPISTFLATSTSEIRGELVERCVHGASVDVAQLNAWTREIELLKIALSAFDVDGHIIFEFSIPRLGRRIDVALLLKSVVFVLEFKVGAAEFSRSAIEQVWDYALDLKNFHEPSHDALIVPILVATEAMEVKELQLPRLDDDKTCQPIRVAPAQLRSVMKAVLESQNAPSIDPRGWENGHYHPTPTIVEAATALYRGHSVGEISRSDAGATNLTRTSAALSHIIQDSMRRSRKSICFVTGVPGAGKTLVGLDIANQHNDKNSSLYSVFLSGNGPLVAILREALVRDTVAQARDAGKLLRKGQAKREVDLRIQNAHHFRDTCLKDGAPPVEHVALFDEAQRAWDRQQTSRFMLQKKKHSGFDQSEPEFLISCLNRHLDWAVVVCLVGGGQEINRGEAGIGEWIESVLRSYPTWHIHISSRLTDSEYGAGAVLQRIAGRANVVFQDPLHLGVSMRAFRAENVSSFVKQTLDLDIPSARRSLEALRERYPIVLSRSFDTARAWLRQRARGTERYGIAVSSQAQRLKPHAIDVRSPIDPIHWFLDGKEDVRSSYYLEDVATEFDIQGLELDWACVGWDADLRLVDGEWQYWSFCGDAWNRIKKPERRAYLKNAYRVLLTRARQGMIIVVPEGDDRDSTRGREYYDGTYRYLSSLGLPTIS